MRRRDVLGALAGVALGGDGALAATLRFGADEVALADRLLRAYPLKGSLAAIGGVYWKERPAAERACPPCLDGAVRGLLDHIEVSKAGLREMPSGELRARIRTETTRDFCHSRVVQVGGWVLGETEARLCAIAALRGA